MMKQVLCTSRFQMCVSLQMADFVRDDRLISEAAMHTYNCLAPLLALPTKSASLLKALTACHLTLTSVQQKQSFTIQVCQPGLPVSACTAIAQYCLDDCCQVRT